MKDIHEVLRRKQARYAQLSKQIEMLQQAAEKRKSRTTTLRSWPMSMSSRTRQRKLLRLLRELPLPLPSQLAAWLLAGPNPGRFHSPYMSGI
jgi:hypothetical protein